MGKCHSATIDLGLSAEKRGKNAHFLVFPQKRFICIFLKMMPKDQTSNLAHIYRLARIFLRDEKSWRIPCMYSPTSPLEGICVSLKELIHMSGALAFAAAAAQGMGL